MSGRDGEKAVGTVTNDAMAPQLLEHQVCVRTKVLPHTFHWMTCFQRLAFPDSVLMSPYFLLGCQYCALVLPLLLPA